VRFRPGEARRHRPPRIAKIASNARTMIVVAAIVTASARPGRSAIAIALGGQFGQPRAGVSSTSALTALAPVAASPATTMSQRARRPRAPSG
jgi:hypothetical protein